MILRNCLSVPSYVCRVKQKLPYQLLQFKPPPYNIQTRPYYNPYLAKLACHWRSFTCFLSPWNLLNKVGVPKKGIIAFRRGLRRFSYPWIEFCLPATMLLGVADVIAQTYVEGVRDKKKYDYRRTIAFMLIGFGVVGPMLSKWNLFLYRTLRCGSQAQYFAKKLSLDVLVLSPVLLAIVMGSFDIQEILEKWPNFKQLWENRYKKPFKDILIVNLQTRPLVYLFLCFISPQSLRKTIKRIYEVAFVTYVSHVFHMAKMGPTTKPLKKTLDESCLIHPNLSKCPKHPAKAKPPPSPPPSAKKKPPPPPPPKKAPPPPIKPPPPKKESK